MPPKMMTVQLIRSDQIPLRLKHHFVAAKLRVTGKKTLDIIILSFNCMKNKIICGLIID